MFPGLTGGYPGVFELALIAVAALLWAAYVDHQDRHQPEPWGHLLLAFLLGGVSGYLGLLGYGLLETWGLRFDAYQLARQDRLDLLIYSILGVGLIEELAKFLPFIIVLARLKAFDEAIDGLVYASFLALGFATFENFFYLPELDVIEATGRAVASPLVHVMFASIWGSAVGRAIVLGRPVLPAALSGLALAVLAHGLYDYVAIGVPELQSAVPPAIIGVIWLWRLERIRQVQNCLDQPATSTPPCA